jgi:hypothetical protein
MSNARCNNCLNEYDKTEVKEVHGKESMVYLLGYCSPQCYETMVEKLKKQKEESTGRI